MEVRCWRSKSEARRMRQAVLQNWTTCFILCELAFLVLVILVFFWWMVEFCFKPQTNWGSSIWSYSVVFFQTLCIQLSWRTCTQDSWAWRIRESIVQMISLGVHLNFEKCIETKKLKAFVRHQRICTEKLPQIWTGINLFVPWNTVCFCYRRNS